ncbi:MAG: 1-acyl-sn-glycerol-3-phosphate acyltransferase, partial [Phycisphaerales bacterium]|nr:1-acyl-sn-glycerol-3-phosphate acyltransferase [Phycisphaerales bacterium]
MFARLRALHPGSSIRHILFYALILNAARLFLRVFYRVRPTGHKGVPPSGPLLIIANHQSYLDPPLVSTGVHNRHVDFVARAGLFKFGPFAWLISTLNSVPISEEGGDTAAMKETLRRLAEGKAVILFPEGTRSPDGAMRPFKRGVAVLVKRAKCPVVPVA